MNAPNHSGKECGRSPGAEPEEAPFSPWMGARPQSDRCPCANDGRRCGLGGGGIISVYPFEFTVQGEPFYTLGFIFG